MLNNKYLIISILFNASALCAVCCVVPALVWISFAFRSALQRERSFPVGFSVQPVVRFFILLFIKKGKNICFRTCKFVKDLFAM